MASAIVATVGSASANSYVTLAELATYAGDRLDVADYTAATDAERTQALLQACRRIEQIADDGSGVGFKGLPVTSTQALAFPRSGIYDRNGNYIEPTVIPVYVKRAQMELAIFMLSEDLLADSGLEGFDHVQVGPLNVTPSSRIAGELPENVRRELQPVLYGTRGTIRLVRA